MSQVLQVEVCEEQGAQGQASHGEPNRRVWVQPGHGEPGHGELRDMPAAAFFFFLSL
jgi:hypothetical protein